jgi:hypothetical protein
VNSITHLKITDQPKLLENYLVVDFETYWCTLPGYELGKMSAEQYGRNSSEIILVWVVASKGADNTIIQTSDREFKFSRLMERKANGYLNKFRPSYMP